MHQSSTAGHLNPILGWHWTYPSTRPQRNSCHWLKWLNRSDLSTCIRHSQLIVVQVILLARRRRLWIEFVFDFFQLIEIFCLWIMTDLLAIPLKKPSEVDVVKPLKNLIQSTYNSTNSDNATDHSEAINEFSKLRNTAIWKAFEKYESSLEIINGWVITASAFRTPFVNICKRRCLALTNNAKVTTSLFRPIVTHSNTLRIDHNASSQKARKSAEFDWI